MRLCRRIVIVVLLCISRVIGGRHGGSGVGGGGGGFQALRPCRGGIVVHIVCARVWCAAAISLEILAAFSTELKTFLSLVVVQKCETIHFIHVRPNRDLALGGHKNEASGARHFLKYKSCPAFSWWECAMFGLAPDVNPEVRGAAREGNLSDGNPTAVGPVARDWKRA